jgi:hypothetical protein
MPCPQLQTWFWSTAYQWQTLIAGIFAVLAAFGTIWATIAAANKEVAAAQYQITVAREQIADSRRREQHSFATKNHAFLLMLKAAMKITIDDVLAAKRLMNGFSINEMPHSPECYQGRRRIRRNGFAEIRGACIQVGGSLSDLFLRLDGEIDDFSSEIFEIIFQDGTKTMLGRHAGYYVQLDRIELMANEIQLEVGKGLERWNIELKKTQPRPQEKM